MSIFPTEKFTIGYTKYDCHPCAHCCRNDRRRNDARRIGTSVLAAIGNDIDGNELQ